MNPLDIRLGDYLKSLEDRNWHTLALLIELERNQLDEQTARELFSVYLTANAKRRNLIELRDQRKTA